LTSIIGAVVQAPMHSTVRSDQLPSGDGLPLASMPSSSLMVCTTASLPRRSQEMLWQTAMRQRARGSKSYIQ